MKIDNSETHISQEGSRAALRARARRTKVMKYIVGRLRYHNMYNSAEESAVFVTQPTIVQSEWFWPFAAFVMALSI